MCSIQTIGDAAPLELEDDVDQFARLGVGQAAADLVEQQRRRAGRQRAGEFEALAVDQAERLGAAVGDAGHAGRRQSTRRRARRLRRGRAPPPWRAAAKTFSNTVMPENGRGIWWVRARPRRQRSAVGSAVTSSPAQPDGPGGRRVRADQDAEQRRLAGPVGADDADGLVGADREVDAVEHHQRVEALVEPAGVEQRFAGVVRHVAVRVFRLSCCRAAAWRRSARWGR